MELYCELLLARFGLVEASGPIDHSIEEAVHGLIYSATRCGEIKELVMIRDQLAQKVGKESYLAMLNNTEGLVNPRLVIKLSAAPPHSILVEQYLAEIAHRYGVPGFGDTELENQIPENTIELISLEEDNLISPSQDLNEKPSEIKAASNSLNTAPDDIFPQKPHSTQPPTVKTSDFVLPTPPKTTPVTSNIASNNKHANSSAAPTKSNNNTSIPTFEELESRFNALKKGS